MSEVSNHEYNFKGIEARWQQYWKEKRIYQVVIDENKPKCYVLDMFPYPSGAGLHVGHPLGYIASDIYSRYKRLKGFNVLHPMGYDAFGLPAEQYAIQTGQHPAVTTEANIKRYREQLDKMGFSYDWEREVRTCDPAYYRWTQWIFLQLFNSWYNPRSNKAEPISSLIEIFEKEGFSLEVSNILTGNMELGDLAFSAADWQAFNKNKCQEILQGFRLAYQDEAYVNWCPAMGTVLSNDEVKDGKSERGGYPVERKLMKQWSMRITAYAERLLNDLENIDWSESIKETQRNWIGKSSGASVNFKLQDKNLDIEVFTTRPDTIFGVSFLAIAPEHELLDSIIDAEYAQVVYDYIEEAKNRSERERQADVKRISGQFTGTYAVHPFSGKAVPVWVADYVLAGYGTGAVMGVPAHDSRDHAFAKHFGLEIVQVIQSGQTLANVQEASYDAKEGTCINSSFLDGLEVKAAIKKAIAEIDARGIGKGATNYRLRDAIFGRQRYWGEPIPMYYKDGIACPIPEEELPLVLPEVDRFLPTEDGEPPLARAKNWKYKGQYDYEHTTMPGWAGSSWYFLRYMDPWNEKEFVSQEAVNYWKNVDLYMGGSEHATGHLLYVRFWTKFLFDRGWLSINEPAEKLINQGMIQGRSNFVYRVQATYQGPIDKNQEEYPQVFVSKNIADRIIREGWNNDEKTLIEGLYEVLNGSKAEARFQGFSPIHVDVNIVKNDVLDIAAFRLWRDDFAEAEFILEEGEYICGYEVEKMSKSKWNVVSPDDIIEQYGADTLRLYEMFLGPLEQSKPWSTQGIEGVHRFLKKLWRLFYDDKGQNLLVEEEPHKKELKTLHKLIKKIADDIANFSFNTSISAFMVCVNELMELNCRKKSVLEPLLICLSPFAPHITEELWQAAGHKKSILLSSYPLLNEEYLREDSFSYPVSINGKHRTNIEMGTDMPQADVEKLVMADEVVQKWLEGKMPKKIVFVKGRIVNVVT